MQSNSTTFQTERIFWRTEADIVGRGEYWLIKSPSNPTHYNGNLLYFDHAPAKDDFHRWMDSFEREFGDLTEARHVLFVWDMPSREPGNTHPFIEAGFDIQHNVTLAAQSVVAPPHLNTDIDVRPITSDDDWAAVLDAKLRLRDPRLDPETFAPFKKTWLEGRRKLAESGHGGWYGAFINDRLVADLGLFHDGPLARFQDVTTETDFRRRGICGTLVYEISRQALNSDRIKTLVMVADENYYAARIYESVGFRPIERHATACKYPGRPDDRNLQPIQPGADPHLDNS